MRQRPPLKVSHSPCSQEISRILWSPNFHYRFRKSPQTVHILSQTNPVHAFPINLFIVHLDIILPSTSMFSMRSLSLRFPLQNHVWSSFSYRATCPALLILLYLLSRIIFGEDYKSWRSSICIYLHYPVTSSLLVQNTFLSALVS